MGNGQKYYVKDISFHPGTLPIEQTGLAHNNKIWNGHTKSLAIFLTQQNPITLTTTQKQILSNNTERVQET